MHLSKYYDQALELAQMTDADLPKVFKLLQRAKQQGDHRATYALGTWYLFGKGDFIVKDLAKAAELLREAADVSRLADDEFEIG